MDHETTTGISCAVPWTMKTRASLVPFHVESSLATWLDTATHENKGISSRSMDHVECHALSGVIPDEPLGERIFHEHLLPFHVVVSGRARRHWSGKSPWAMKTHSCPCVVP